MLEFSDIQGIALSAHAHAKYSRVLFLQIQDVKLAKAWLKNMLPQIATAARRPKGSPKPEAAAQIAMTAPGFIKLGLSQDAMGTFPREFTQGMGHGERTRVLGDVDDSAPEKWQVGGSNTPEVHIMLMFYATGPQKIEEVTRQACSGHEGAVKEVFRQDSYRANDYEPFGFHDGVSQPAIEGLGGKTYPGQEV